MVFWCSWGRELSKHTKCKKSIKFFNLKLFSPTICTPGSIWEHRVNWSVVYVGLHSTRTKKFYLKSTQNTARTRRNNLLTRNLTHFNSKPKRTRSEIKLAYICNTIKKKIVHNYNSTIN